MGGHHEGIYMCKIWCWCSNVAETVHIFPHTIFHTRFSLMRSSIFENMFGNMQLFTCPQPARPSATKNKPTSTRTSSQLDPYGLHFNADGPSGTVWNSARPPITHTHAHTHTHTHTHALPFSWGSPWTQTSYMTIRWNKTHTKHAGPLAMGVLDLEWSF